MSRTVGSSLARFLMLDMWNWKGLIISRGLNLT